MERTAGIGRLQRPQAALFPLTKRPGASIFEDDGSVVVFVVLSVACLHVPAAKGLAFLVGALNKHENS